MQGSAGGCRVLYSPCRVLYMNGNSFFRIQPADSDPRELLNPRNQFSHAWHEYDDRTTRNGVSVCGSRESLACYLATVGAGIPYGDGEWLLIELTGYFSDDQPLDAEFGEYLIHPTEIISAAPIDDEFWEMIGAAHDAYMGVGN